MTWTDDLLNKTKQFGIHGYPLSKCLLILDLLRQEEEEYARQFDTPQSAIRRAYDKGAAYAEFAFDNVLFKKGTDGDIRAMQEYEKRRRINTIRK